MHTLVVVLLLFSVEIAYIEARGLGPAIDTDIKIPLPFPVFDIQPPFDQLPVNHIPFNAPVPRLIRAILMGLDGSSRLAQYLVTNEVDDKKSELEQEEYPHAAGGGTNLPGHSYSNNLPAVSYANNVPLPSHGNNVPDDSYANTIPVTSYANNVPVRSHGNNVPEDSYANTIPVTSYANNAPVTSYENNVPETSYVYNVPEDSYKVPEVPEHNAKETHHFSHDEPETGYIEVPAVPQQQLRKQVNLPTHDFPPWTPSFNELRPFTEFGHHHQTVLANTPVSNVVSPPPAFSLVSNSILPLAQLLKEQMRHPGTPTGDDASQVKGLNSEDEDRESALRSLAERLVRRAALRAQNMRQRIRVRGVRPSAEETTSSTSTSSLANAPEPIDTTMASTTEGVEGEQRERRRPLRSFLTNLNFIPQ